MSGYQSGPNWGSSRNSYQYDVANWGYIILYLVVILFSLFGNALFLFTIKKNPQLRKTQHFFLAALAVRDLIVTFLVIPFVIDSQAVNLMRWKAGKFGCKIFTFFNYATMSIHAFMLIFQLIFLYFWYRKQESYMTQEGTTVVRQTKMHKWAIPLAWVIGAGIAIPAGAMANQMYQQGGDSKLVCAVWDTDLPSHKNEYKVEVSTVFVSFFVPVIVMLFPFIALLMQVCGGRQPRLDPPHNRNAILLLAVSVLFVISRAPKEVYQLMKLFQASDFGYKGAGGPFGTPYGYYNFETDIILNALVYVVCAVHPILYFSFSQEYRQGLVNMWRNLDCNQSSAERARRMEEKRRGRQQYPPAANSNGNSGPIIKNNRAPGHMRAPEVPLLRNPQPQIMPSGPGQPQYHPYPQGVPHGVGVQVLPQVPQPGTHGQYLFPQHVLEGGVPALNNSFERATPQLPPVFEFYDGDKNFKYMDSARMEPRIAYSPEKTPPKTPTTPRFNHTPFVPPGNIPVNPNAVWPPPEPSMNFEMAEMSPPLATSEAKEEFQLEALEGSPGNTLRERNRRITSPPTSPIQDDPEERIIPIEMLQNSPGNRNRRSQESGQQPREQKTNGAMHRSMSPTASGTESGSVSGSNVEIVITGRTRSRQDLCPDVPQSKFEHAV